MFLGALVSMTPSATGYIPFSCQLSYQFPLMVSCMDIFLTQGELGREILFLLFFSALQKKLSVDP